MPFDDKSCCGKCHCISSSGYAHACEIDSTSEEARKITHEVAKRFEETGQKVCGQCAATLFSDTIK